MHVPIQIFLFLVLTIPIVSIARTIDTAYKAISPEDELVWVHTLDDFDSEAYHTALSRLIHQFERTSGRKLQPGEQRRVGLKIYSNSGPGIATPKPLIEAIIRFLETRGFNRTEITIFDLDLRMLWESGFVASRTMPSWNFQGTPVIPILDSNLFDPNWFYDSPLPAERFEYASVTENPYSWSAPEIHDRKSYLPVSLLLDVDFWINLPVITDHPSLGINGVLANATLWNISNQYRFLGNPMGAAAAIAEIAAIPELQRGWVFSIVSLEKMQFMGGPQFNANYVRSIPELFLSTNPVALDYHFLDRINRGRASSGFRAIAPTPPVFEYARSLGLGEFDPEIITILPLTSR